MPSRKGDTGDPGSESSGRDEDCAELREQLREREEAMEAIRNATIDSLIIGRPGEEQVYSLLSADRSYRLIVEAMNEGAATVSAEGVILYANPHLAQMLGRSRSELIGLSAASLATTSSLAELARTLEVGSWESARAELHLLLPDGSALPVSVASSGFKLDDTLMRCLVVTDLTASRQAQTDLNRANDGLRQRATELFEARDVAQRATLEALAATRAKSAFLAAMSHEIRTPMHAVISLTGLLLDTPLSATQHEYLQTINSSGDALLAIINDILDYSKIESGAMDLELAPFKVRDLIASAVDQNRPQARNKRLDLLVDIAADCPPWVVGDLTRLRQILVNLLGNAVKFTAAGEVVITVGVTETNGGGLELAAAVRDTGIGIQADDIGRLFRPFSQVEPSTTRIYGGSGLGLAISARLVEAMGGRLEVESDPGQGSTFRFRVQVSRYDSAETHESLASDPSLASRVPDGEPDQTANTGTSVLLVEDNMVNQKIALIMLKRAGSVADVAGNGVEALAALRRRPYDVVLMDVQMPEMDGLEATRQTRTTFPASRQPTIIGMTANALTEDRSACLDAGMDDFMAKPFRAEELTAMLVKWQAAGLTHAASVRGRPGLG